MLAMLGRSLASLRLPLCFDGLCNFRRLLNHTFGRPLCTKLPHPSRQGCSGVFSVYGQVLSTIKATEDRYGVTCAAQDIDEASRVGDRAAVSFATGCLFQHFEDASDKVALRKDVIAVMANLTARNLSKETLCPALRARVDACMAFKLAV
jgi:hypothetical protein